MIQQVLYTSDDFVFLLIRVIAGSIILPYGLKKLFKANGGAGIRATLEDLRCKNVPRFIAWMVIVAQSFGALALIIGLFGRVAAAGNFILFTGALIVHAPDGWFLNWFGRKKGEGIEYFVLLLTLLLIVMIRGSGPFSCDRWILSQITRNLS